MATITETLNGLYTSTWAKRRAGVVDQVFEENRFTSLLKSKGMLKSESTDGRRLEIPLRVARPDSAKFFSKGVGFFHILKRTDKYCILIGVSIF